MVYSVAIEYKLKQNKHCSFPETKPKQDRGLIQDRRKYNRNQRNIYIYLGCILSETLDFTITATALAESAKSYQ